MNLEDQKSLALKACIDLTENYTEEEVKKFAPVSVQNAWKIGSEYLDWRIKEDRKSRKGFVI